MTGAVKWSPSADPASFSCVLPVTASAARRWLHHSPWLIGAGGVLLAMASLPDSGGLAAVTERLDGGDFSLIAGLLLAAVALAGWAQAPRARDPRWLPQGVLAIAADGALGWQAADRPASARLRLLRWYAGANVAWLQVQPDREVGSFSLLLVRGADDDVAWRRLQAWLVWRQRAGTRS